jgi:hypothetical protein
MQVCQNHSPQHRGQDRARGGGPRSPPPPMRPYCSPSLAQAAGSTCCPGFKRCRSWHCIRMGTTRMAASSNSENRESGGSRQENCLPCRAPMPVLSIEPRRPGP